MIAWQDHFKQRHHDSSSKNPVTNQDNQTRKTILIRNNLKLWFEILAEYVNKNY